MFRNRIAPLLIAVVVAAALGACSQAENGTNAGAGVTVDTPANPLTENAAKLAADALLLPGRTALEGLGFTGVDVTSEMETEGGQTYAIVSAVVSLPQLENGCKLRFKSRTTQLGFTFDKVITPQKPAGVEVKDAARNDTSPPGVFNYLLANHPACLIPGATVPTA